MAKRDILDNADWIVLCACTKEPKLSYIISRLDDADISNVRIRVGFETKLMVPYKDIAKAWKAFRPEIDNMRDDHPFFYRWRRAIRYSK
jgi:hypothetical protein